MRATGLLFATLLCGCRSEAPLDRSGSRTDTTHPSTRQSLGVQLADTPVRQPQRARTDAELDSAFGLRRGDSTFHISGPSLITTFPITGRDLDASEHAGDALDQYKASLSRASARLREAGVSVYATNDDVLRWRDSLGEHSISTIGHYAILYVFVGRDGQATVLRSGIQSEEAILDAARKHFAVAIPDAGLH